jgi:hypothetical protein
MALQPNDFTYSWGVVGKLPSAGFFEFIIFVSNKWSKMLLKTDKQIPRIGVLA